MKKSIFGFILAILLICPFMSQVLRAEARDTDSKVTDADKIFYKNVLRVYQDVLK